MKDKGKKIKALVEEIPLEEKTSATAFSEPAISESKEEKVFVESQKSIGVAETQNVVPEPHLPKEKGKFLLFFFITLAVTVFIAFLAGGFFVYYTGVRSLNVLPSPTSSPVPSITSSPSATSSPTASPATNKKLSEYKIQVLNGSGIIGAATEVKTILEKAGFKVTATGNASNFNYKETLVATKPSVSKGIISTIEDLLSKTYTLKLEEKSLKETATYDIVISVGLKQ